MITSGGGLQRPAHTMDNSHAMELVLMAHEEHATTSSGSQGLEAKIGTTTSSVGSQRLAHAMGKSCVMGLMPTGHSAAQRRLLWGAWSG